ncbi:MAG: TIGR04084 family radical SAM/SPASM domain-containing protein [Candidatus Woesearchaeota archaeon]
MHYHIVLTERCNSHCKYCYEKSIKEFDNSLSKKWEFDHNVPVNSEIDTEKIVEFLEAGDSLIFYGGEPLINFEKMKGIMDSIESSESGKAGKIKFKMQTNGKILDSIPKEYVNKISKMLVSIDGHRGRTDFNRGQGTYDKVIENINKIRKHGFKGEIVARMTLSFDTSPGYDIYEQVMHLIDLIDKGIFDSVHWQIDAGFYEFDFNYKKFNEFVKKYNENIEKLVDFWVENIKQGRVYRIYPFLGIFESLYYKKPSKLRCGSGYANYTINTNGKISPCPIMNNIKNFYCGDLDSKIRNKELKEFHPGGKCKNCEYLWVCGGRCLYENYSGLWPQEGRDLICKTIIHLVESIKNRITDIKECINGGIVNKSDFIYEKYFGPEIIP